MKFISVFFTFLLPFLLRVYQKVQCFILFGLKYIVVVRWGEHRIKVEQRTCKPSAIVLYTCTCKSIRAICVLSN